MKRFYIIIFLVLCYICNGQISISCLPDKGIKTAKTFAMLETESRVIHKNESNYREVYYDIEGRAILIKNGRDKSIHNREYKDGKLHFMISTRKKLPDFYSVEDEDSLIENTKTVTDTVKITRYYKNGNVAELKLADGVFQIFEYQGCKVESHTLLNSIGDTIQQNQSFFKNGVVIKTIWTPFQPVKSVVVTEYYDYQFNRRGHWVRRKYRSNEGLIIEKRVLIYY